MKKVTIQFNTFDYDGMPTVQDDNAGGIYEKWELFFNGISIGKLIKYYDKTFAVFHEVNGYTVRYDFKQHDVIFN